MKPVAAEQRQVAAIVIVRPHLGRHVVDEARAQREVLVAQQLVDIAARHEQRELLSGAVCASALALTHTGYLQLIILADRRHYSGHETLFQGARAFWMFRGGLAGGLVQR